MTFRRSSLTNAEAQYPAPNLKPSMTSIEVSSDRDSSIVIEPSCPTLSTAKAIRSPMLLSLLAEIVAMCLMSSMLVTGFAISDRLSQISETVASIPLCSSMGETPATMWRWASFKIALARTVAVVVPSPALVFVSLAAWRITCAPAFSNSSSNWTNCATVTPSLVAKAGLSFSFRSTVRPFGPRVEET